MHFDLHESASVSVSGLGNWWEPKFRGQSCENAELERNSH
jgi:hypothetical protein